MRSGPTVMQIYGCHPVREALKAGHVASLRVSVRGGDRVRELVRMAEAAGVPTTAVPPAVLDRVTQGAVHQGIVARLRDRPRFGLEALAAAAGAPPPLIVVLDGVEDPQNVGAILRTVDAAGASGVVRQTRRGARLEGAAAKASAGAVEHVRIVDVVNVARAVEELKTLGIWSVGLVGEAEQSYDRLDLTGPVALVVGAEGKGLRRLVRERCDYLASIPMAGEVESLNVSVATAVVLFEAVRQRRTQAGR